MELIVDIICIACVIFYLIARYHYKKLLKQQKQTESEVTEHDGV